MPTHLSQVLTDVLQGLAVTAAGLLALCATSATASTEIGRLGPTYPIAEPDMLLEIEQIVRDKASSGELQRLQEDETRRITARARTPEPVSGLRRTVQAHTHYWDPTIALQEDVVDHRGKVVISKGTRKNPLDVISLRHSMLFIDARDPGQQQMAREANARLGEKLITILVAGPVVDLMERWGTRLYFDQGGRLVNRFAIHQVPAWVYQEGKRLRIDEVLPPQTQSGGVQ